MKSTSAIFVISASATVAASASVPPSDWKPPTWKGPGLLCGSAFTLRLEPGETAVQGFPSVGRIPFTIDAGRARFGIVEDWFGPREPGPRKLVRRITGGKLFALPDVRGNASRSFVFVPAKKKALKFELTFYDAIGNQFAAFPPARESSVFKRLAFAGDKPSTCLKEVDPS